MPTLRSPADPRLACPELVYGLYAAIDNGHASAAADLFTRTATYQTSNGDRTGHEAIRAGFADREARTSRRTRHVVTNVRLRADSPGTAVCTATLVLYVLSDPDPTIPRRIAEITDRFEHDGERWLISEHRSTPLADRR